MVIIIGNPRQNNILFHANTLEKYINTLIYSFSRLAQSAGAAEYIDCISAEG